MNRPYWLIAALLILGGASKAVNACASIAPNDTPIGIDAEETIIIWDAHHHTEHFIRTAHFNTQAKDFGFLVPTPTIPKLKSVDAESLRGLDEFTAPEQIEHARSKWILGSWLFPDIAPLPLKHIVQR